MTQQCAYFGGHIEMLEVDETRRFAPKGIDQGDSAVASRIFGKLSTCSRTVRWSNYERAARTSVALDRLIEIHKLGSLAYYYEGVGNAENEEPSAPSFLEPGLATARGIPVAVRIRDQERSSHEDNGCFGVGVLHGILRLRFQRRCNLSLATDGPGHIAIAQGKTKVRPLSVLYGKVGSGLSR